VTERATRRSRGGDMNGAREGSFLAGVSQLGHSQPPTLVQAFGGCNGSVAAAGSGPPPFFPPARAPRSRRSRNIRVARAGTMGPGTVFRAETDRHARKVAMPQSRTPLTDTLAAIAVDRPAPNPAAPGKVRASAWSLCRGLDCAGRRARPCSARRVRTLCARPFEKPPSNELFLTSDRGINRARHPGAVRFLGAAIAARARAGI
jgi:hypothetical protein